LLARLEQTPARYEITKKEMAYLEREKNETTKLLTYHDESLPNVTLLGTKSCKIRRPPKK
jgi:hypothetical protein